MTESIIFKLSDGTELKNGDPIFYFAEAGRHIRPIKSYDKFPYWDPVLVTVYEGKFEYAYYDHTSHCFRLQVLPNVGFDEKPVAIRASEWGKTFFLSEEDAKNAKSKVVLGRKFDIPYLLNNIHNECFANESVRISIKYFSDGYHTFGELYSHRTALLAALVKTLPSKITWKSKKHSDGTMFDDMFIVGIDLLEGTISYHIHMNEENGDSNWDLFQCKELDKAPVWDGWYTPNDVVERLRKFASSLDIKNDSADGDDFVSMPAINDNIQPGIYKVVGRLRLDTRKCSCGCDRYKVIRVVDPEIVSERSTVGYSLICEHCYKEFCYL